MTQRQPSERQRALWALWALAGYVVPRVSDEGCGAAWSGRGSNFHVAEADSRATARPTKLWTMETMTFNLLRRRHGLTLTRVAREARCAPRTARRFERGLAVRDASAERLRAAYWRLTTPRYFDDSGTLLRPIRPA